MDLEHPSEAAIQPPHPSIEMDPHAARGSTRAQVKTIHAAIANEAQRLKTRHPWLEHTERWGLVAFFGSLLAMGLVSGLYLEGLLTWWLALPLMAMAISILHELEHDLIHGLYFRRRPWIQHGMFFVIWWAKLSLNPWYRKHIHLLHHKVSGQVDDIEERLIGLGLPFGALRALVAIHPLGAIFLLRRIKRDAPQLRILELMGKSLPTYLSFAVLFQLFLSYSRALWLHPEQPFWLLPAWGWPIVQSLMVLWVGPNILRQASLVLMSSYSHYYEDIPRNDVYFQNQVLAHPLLWPFQLFCFNFGATHVLHHYVVDQPFYLRQLVYAGVRETLIEQGVRINDSGVIRRANRRS